MKPHPSNPPGRLRAVRPDAEGPNRVFLIKNVPFLRATYQIRLLAFLARQRCKRLVLRVPRRCRFDPELSAMVESPEAGILREDLP
jgi:hypothetical protein